MGDDIGEALQPIGQSTCFPVKYENFSLNAPTGNGLAIGGHGHCVESAFYSTANGGTKNSSEFKIGQFPDAHCLVEGDAGQIAILLVSTDS